MFRHICRLFKVKRRETPSQLLERTSSHCNRETAVQEAGDKLQTLMHQARCKRKVPIGEHH